MSKEIENLLMESKIAIDNAIGVESVSAKLALFGYTPDKLENGSKLEATARIAVDRQNKEYGEQYLATEDLHRAEIESKALYITDLGLARIAFADNPDARKALSLDGERKEALGLYITQALRFYTALLGNETWLEAMSAFNRTPEILQEGRDSIVQIEQQWKKQLKEMGEAQQATEQRDAAVDELAMWYSPFKKVARLALRNDPQLLEIMGYTAPSE